ncbi:MAG: DUF1499 domain-containing protein [Granulosicoccaceae bacterium]
MKTLIIILITPLVLWTLMRGVIVPLLSSKSAAAGLHENGQLGACPADSQNCVCSLDTDSHAVEPLAFTNAGQAQWQSLLDAMSSLPGWKLISKDGSYAHFESRTPLMNYVDDIEVHWQSDAEKVQVRSKSRLGVKDLGANKKRVEMLRVLAANTLKGS